MKQSRKKILIIILQGSDLARMRRCAQRVGNDFRQVIAREHGKTNRQGE